MLTLPNVITLGRLCAVPLAVWLIIQGRMQAAFWLFVAAGISDAFDGYYARRFEARSALGAILDPLADKVLLVSVYVTLGFTGRIPDWLVILVVFRDLLIMGGVVVMTILDEAPAIAPILVSKLNTAVQITLAAGVLLRAAYGLPSDELLNALVWITAATTLVSGAAYVRRWQLGAGR